MKNDPYISQHITYREVIKSSTAKTHGINNVPNSEQLKNIIIFCNELFEPLRKISGKPIFSSSFFRCDELNEHPKIAGSKTTQHLAKKGAAGDFDNDGYDDCSTNAEIFWIIFDYLNFDQLIWEAGNEEEPGWVHVSYVSEELNRNEILRFIPGEGYITFDLKR